MKKRVIYFLILFCIVFSKTNLAQHDENCGECHNLHDAKAPFSLAVKPDTTIVNPYTKEKLSGQAAICMGCHNGSGGPEVDMKKTHPVGMKPNKVKVDPDLLNKNGIFDCGSCHDFHPNNPNYKYLRVDVKSDKIGYFCALCHSAQRKQGSPKPVLEKEK